jgi:hypothetical protein
VPAPLPPERTLTLVSAGAMAGVLLFGALAWHLSHARPVNPPLDPALRYGCIALLTLAAAVFLGLRGRLAPGLPRQRQLSVAVVILAVAEAAAMAGGVALFLSGDATLWIAGAALLAAVAATLRIRA